MTHTQDFNFFFLLYEQVPWKVLDSLCIELTKSQLDTALT